MHLRMQQLSDIFLNRFMPARQQWIRLLLQLESSGHAFKHRMVSAPAARYAADVEKEAPGNNSTNSRSALLPVNGLFTKLKCRSLAPCASCPVAAYAVAGLTLANTCLIPGEYLGIQKVYHPSIILRSSFAHPSSGPDLMLCFNP